MRLDPFCIEGSVLRILYIPNVGFGNLKFAGWFGLAMFTGKIKEKKNCIFSKVHISVSLFYRVITNSTFSV